MYNFEHYIRVIIIQENALSIPITVRGGGGGGRKKSVNVNRRDRAVFSFTSKYTTANNGGKFDARLTAWAIDHSHVDQISLRKIHKRSPGEL